MALIDAMCSDAPEGVIVDVAVGPAWICVEVETGGERHCGLAPALPASSHDGELPPAGTRSAEVLAHAGSQTRPRLSSVAVATLNALLPTPGAGFEQNGEELIADIGTGLKVAMVGHFPFVERLRRRVGRLSVIERAPRPGDYPEAAAGSIIPAADVVAITAMTLVNGSFDGVLSLCRPEARVILLGPSTPLSPRLFAAGVDILAGAVVADRRGVQAAIPGARSFRQLKHAGVRLVTIERPASPTER